jgi:hypothetical protein
VTAESHAECADYLKTGFAELGCEVTVSTLPPLVSSPYEQAPAICPHGTTYYFEPTSEQIAAWVRDGVA